MNILAPTLVMAQIYEVNEILFFSRSTINRFAKNKILAFGEKTNKMIRFFDGVTLEALICTYASELPKKYSPVKYMSDCEIAKVDDSFVNVFFFKMLFLVYIMRWRTFKIIHLQKRFIITKPLH